VVADIARHSSSANGLQPLSLARHWREVLDLIELAFGDALDLEAQRALRSMRLPPLLTPVIGFFDHLAPPGEGMMPGYVWLEHGHVVGTASVRRVHPFNQGWLISNVAVHPDYQGRGIGRALMEACLDFAEDFGGTWVVLQARGDNHVARHLYASLGFQAIGEIVRFHKETARVPDDLPPSSVELSLRPAGWSDGRPLRRLAQALTSYDILWPDNLNRELYETGLFGRLSARLRGRQRQWWLQDRSPEDTGRRNHGIFAAVGIERDRDLPWHRLRILIKPRAQSETLAVALAEFGLQQLSTLPLEPVEIEHPASDQDTQAALAKVGFHPVYSLVHMRLNLR
jgi:ribosomal protein S18 acetylase RimI-like enzyme